LPLLALIDKVKRDAEHWKLQTQLPAWACGWEAFREAGGRYVLRHWGREIETEAYLALSEAVEEAYRWAIYQDLLPEAETRFYWQHNSTFPEAPPKLKTHLLCCATCGPRDPSCRRPRWMQSEDESHWKI